MVKGSVANKKMPISTYHIIGEYGIQVQKASKALAQE